MSQDREKINVADEVSDTAGPDQREEKVRKLEKSLEQKASIFEASVRLYERLGSTFDIDRISRLLLMTLSEQIGLEAVSLYLAVPDKTEFGLSHSLGVDSDLLPCSIGFGSDFSRWLKAEKGMLFIDRYFASVPEPSEDEVAMLTTLGKAGFSYASFIENDGDDLGILFFSSRSENRAFDESDKECLRMFMRAGAITIKNALRFHQSERYRERSEQFARVKSEYMGENSVHLKTALSVLKSSLWSIESDGPGNAIMVDMARDATTSMESSLNSFLALVDAGMEDTPLDLERADLASVVEDCLREYIPELEEKSVTVKLKDGLAGREVFLDPSRIMVVVRNIVDNALQAVSRGGLLIVDIRMIGSGPSSEDGIQLQDWNLNECEIAREETVESSHDEYRQLESISEEISFQKSIEQSYAVISIEDNGIGIPESEIRSISQPFRKIHCPIDGDSGRPGIGLSVAQNIVAGHGGVILCRSEIGKGTKFSVWLPLD
jgi:signal transduction histidine kinase